MRTYFIYSSWLLILISLLVILPRATAAEDWIYTIRSGDNLWNLTERHLTSFRYVTRLQQLNNIQNPNLIPPGTKIRIPLAWVRPQPGGGHARVVGVHGIAMAQHKDTTEKIPVELGMQLLVGDEIESTDDAYVTIEFSDQSRLRVQDNSKVRLQRMEIFGQNGLVDTMVEVLYGRTESLVHSKSEVGTRLRIKTPSAISSVRGTEFRVGVLEDGSSTSSEVLAGLVAVRSKNREVNIPGGFGSLTKYGAVPSPPVALLEPPDLSITPKLYESLPLVIPLNPLSGAQAYRAQIAVDHEFQNLWADFATAKLPFRDGEIPDGDYWLRVRGVDDLGIEGRDAIMAFTLNARPEPPFVMAPLPGASVGSQNPAFRWTVQSAAAHYIVAVGQESDFSNPIFFDPEVPDNFLQLTDSLEPGHYIWHIASVSATEGAGPFSDPMAFRVPFPGPSLDETKINENEITFAWGTAAEGQSFHFQLASDEEFNEIVYDKQTLSSHATIPRPGSGDYFLRIKTIEADGFVGPWGPPQIIDIPHDIPYWLILLLLPLLILI